MRGAVIAVALALCACGDEPAPVSVVVGGEIESLAWSPREPVMAARRTPFGVVLEIDPERLPRTLTLQAPNACPVELALGDARSGELRRAELRPWLSISGGELSQLGFDTPFALAVAAGCDDAASGRIEWKQLSGAPVRLAVTKHGFLASGRMPPLDAPVPHGIVPLSPRTRGEVVLEARWRGGGREVVTRVKLAAAARSTGLPSVAPGQRVLLGGDGWLVRERPRGGRASIEPHAGVLALRPDARGRWLLEDAHGARLSIAVGTHGDATLDCGRSDCHASAARNAESSPMTTVFSRGLRGELSGWEPECVDGCHTVGEPGLDDAGFSDVARELGYASLTAASLGTWGDLARPLRRLSGVGCTSCHGPGAIPEPSANWAILRSDVCATCHDAPPRYPHVAQWSSTKMAHADATPATRAQAECRSCHTASGFLGRKPAPEHALGIGCAACHAPHAAEHGSKLLRQIALPAGFGELPASATPSRVCVACHASAKDALPRASAATILFGAPHAHATLAGGCIACHGAPRDARGRLDHGFRVDRRTCVGCHPGGSDEKPTAGESIQDRARKLFARLGRKTSELPPHASDAKADDRAELLVRLVLEDPAAAMHNAARARALLDEAERLLAK